MKYIIAAVLALMPYQAFGKCTKEYTLHQSGKVVYHCNGTIEEQFGRGFDAGQTVGVMYGIGGTLLATFVIYGLATNWQSTSFNLTTEADNDTLKLRFAIPFP